MKEIPLTQGKVALVDDADAAIVAPYKWYASRHRGTFYARTDTGGRLVRRRLAMHRVILGLGAGDGREVDHINGNGLDNRRANLRICTHAENLRNRGPQRNNRSGYKGVSLHPDGKWTAHISINGSRNVRYLGLFSTPEDAARAYDAAARDLFGEYARLNFPDRA